MLRRMNFVEMIDDQDDAGDECSEAVDRCASTPAGWSATWRHRRTMPDWDSVKEMKTPTR